MKYFLLSGIRKKDQKNFRNKALSNLLYTYCSVINYSVQQYQ